MSQQIDRLNQQIAELVHEGRLREAIAPARAVADLLRAPVGDRDVRYAQALQRLASLHEGIGDCAAAEALYRQVIELLTAILGSLHPDLAPVLSDLARVCQALGKVDEAQSLRARAATIHEAAGELSRSAPEPTAPVARRAPPEQVQRHATVRYYSRMEPHRLYPLLVVISRDMVVKFRRGDFTETESKGFTGSTASPVLVEPVLPGCACYPPRREVAVEAETATAQFQIAAAVEGTLEAAKVILVQEGRLLAEVPLTVRVAKTTLGWVLAGLSLVVPYALKYFDLDLETQVKERFGLYFQIIHYVLGLVAQLPSWVTGGTLLIAGVTVLVLRWPRRELSPSVFYKVEVVSPESRLREAEEALAAQRTTHGLRLLDELTRSRPEFQPAWLAAAGWHARQGRFAEALTNYERAFALGPASARHYFQAGQAAAQQRQYPHAARLVQRGLDRNPGSDLLMRMQFNLGCYLAQVGDADGAVRSLQEAVRAGLRDPRPYRDDAELAPLREHPEYRKLLEQLRV